MLRRFVTAFALASLATLSNACSVCFAHALGAALQGLGAQTLAKGKTLVGLEFLSFNKSNVGEELGAREREHHREYVVTVLHGLTDQVTVGATLPYIDNTIIQAGIEEPDKHARGFGDATVGAIYQLKPSMEGDLLAAFSLNIKLPTGNNDSRDENGDLKEQHLQLGTGSTDFAGGVAFTWQGDEHKGLWYAGLTGRINGSNKRDFHYGNAIFYGFGYSHPMGFDGAIGLEINGKIVAKDKQEDGEEDGNSGGHMIFAAVNLRVPIARDLGLIASYQQPIYERLNGDQTEHGIFSLAITRLF